MIRVVTVIMRIMKTRDICPLSRATCLCSINSRLKILVTSILIALPGFAVAQTEITPYVSIKESLVYEEDDTSSNSGQITTLAPGIRVVSTGPRSELSLDYSLLANYSSWLDEDDRVVNLLNLLGNYQHIPGKWISTLRASSELSSIDANRRQNTNPNFDNGNSEELHTIAIDTTVTDRLTDTIQYRASTGADYLDYDGGDDSTGWNLLLGLDNFRSPNDFTWSTEAARDIAKEGGDSDRIDTYDVYLNYRLTRIWSTFYTYTHTEVDFGDSDFDDSDPDDAWLLGLNWQPNSRTSVSAGAGGRGDDENYSLDAVHTRQNFSLSASYSEDITTGRRDTLNQQQSDFLAQSTTDSISAEPILQKRADLNFSIFGQYSTISTSIFQTDRSSRSGTQDEIITGGIISYLRELSVRDNLTISLLGQKIKDDENNDLAELTVSYFRTHSKNETIILSTEWTNENSTRSSDDYKRFLVSAEYRVTF